ncbi:AraC family transcriptional regulator [Arsenicibacter rosenii]|uniref:AraC family transcriptional regulator n=2 Tax=Arsenicibacter rosenii TaxID=1750698 RepID=A0A1S2VK43_9BACT|nr:AraC family transcriptional regulator [Arsenicibacter rosenii]
MPVPKLNPSQFDEYLFGTWKPTVSGFYERFHIERIENYKAHLKLPVLPHRRSVYFFIFVTKGLAVRSKGLTRYEVGPGMLFCLAADQITSLEAISDDVEGFYCHFRPELFHHAHLPVNLEQEFPFFSLTADQPLICVPQSDRLCALLDILLAERLRNDPARIRLVALYLTALLTELNHLNQSLPATSPTAAAALTQRYKRLLSERIYEKNTVSELAAILGISANHLNKCVKSTTGKSAHELLEDIRILEAKVLLKQTRLPVADIAFKIGGFDPSDFARFFKTKTGLSPKSYRNLPE